MCGSIPRHCLTAETAPLSTTQKKDAHLPKPHILRDTMKIELLTLLTLLAWENPPSEFSNRVHIPQAVDQMLLGNAENKASLSFPSASWEWLNEVEKKGMDPWHTGWRKKEQAISPLHWRGSLIVTCQGNSGTLKLKTLKSSLGKASNSPSNS